MRPLVVAITLLAACRFDTAGVDDPINGDDGDDAPAPDASTDGTDCPCPLGCTSDGTCATFDPSNLDDLALLDGVDTELTLTAGTWILDTDLPELRDPLGNPVAGLSFSTIGDVTVLAVRTLQIDPDALLRGTGDHALLIAGDTIVVAGTLDVSAGCLVDPDTPDRDRLWCGGPGGGDGGHPVGDGSAAATGCAPGQAGDAGTFTAEDGGGGGAFGSAGGDGGNADDGHGQGGVACGSAALEPLTGGSGGGAAGYRASGADDNRTAGGGGGGAVQLVARTGITITGTVDAAGEGGAGTAQAGSFSPPGGDGGGGGGSGGGILLEAPRIVLAASAIVTANGGGGGAGVTTDQRGERGRRDRTRAAGGVNDDATTGGLGATDSGGDESATDGASADDGGSGGGGGAGRIHIHAATPSLDPSAIVSPNPTTAPLVANPG
jgi:hypothetical protein